MESIFEKLGLFDFFNVLITGGIFIFFVHWLFQININMFEINITSTSAVALIFIGACYLVGLALQEIGEQIEKRLIRCTYNLTGSFLMKNSQIIGNTIKLSVYRSMGIQLLAQKGIIIEEDFTEEQCRYIYGYCIYYIAVRGKDSKVEKMKALLGLSVGLCCCFAIISTLGTIKLTCEFIMIKLNNILNTIIIIIISTLFTLLFLYRINQYTMYRIRMLMGTFEACVDLNEIETGCD